MRQMLMSALAVLCLVNVCFSQGNLKTHETLTLQTFDEFGQLIVQTNLEGVEARNFDVPQFLSEQLDATRIKVRGTFYKDSQVDKIKFDSGDLTEEERGLHYCETESFTMKPFLGVSAYSRDDFNGVDIERVVADSPADVAGFEVGDIILTFNGLLIETYCDLKLEIGRCEVGQVVPVEMIVDGQTVNVLVTIGGQLYKEIGYVVCDKADIVVKPSERISDFVNTDMNVFPNPSSGTSQLNFLSSSLQPVTFYVLDINGASIYKESVNGFNGSFKASYTFENVADGVYLFLIEQNGKVYKEQVIYTK